MLVFVLAVLSPPISGPSPAAQLLSETEEDIRCTRYKECICLVIFCPELLVIVFNSYYCLSSGVPCLRKQSPAGAAHDHPQAKRAVRCALTGSENPVETVSVYSSAPVVSGGGVASERSPPICEGELCGVSSPPVRLGWIRPCLFAVICVL